MPKKGYKQTKEHRNNIGKVQEGKKLSKRHKDNISEANRGNPKVIESQKKLWRDPEYRKTMSKSHSISSKKMWNDNPDIRKKASQNTSKALKGKTYKELGRKLVSEKTKEKQKQATLKKWQNPEYRKRTIKNILKALHFKPNKTERFLINFFNKILPNEYKFVGDAQFILDGKCPDFMNINGKKKLIEFFGDYWHGKEKTGKTKKEAENERINHFKKFGYDTLIIWENELKNLELLKNKLITFHVSISNKNTR